MLYILAILLYIAMIGFVAYISKNKIKGFSDFFLGGRSVNPWMSAFSYGTAYFSAVLFIGYAGKIGWGFGMSALWIVLGNALLGCYLAWGILGKKTREMTQRLNISTMPEFLEIRYNNKKLKAVTSFIIFLFLVPYSASVYKGLGYLFEQIFGIPTIYVLLLMTTLTGLYLYFGGFVAATLADFIQGIIMLIGVALMLFFVVGTSTVGGIDNVIPALYSISPQLVDPVGPPGFVALASLVILTSLGTWGLPQMIHKFYTIKDEKSVKCAKWVSTFFALIISFGAYFMGVLGRLFFPTAPPTYMGLPTFDMIIPTMVDTALPNWVAAIILVLVLSASMSTLASLVLASSSAVVVDFLKEMKPNITGTELMKTMRIVCLMFVILSFILAIFPTPIISLAALSWGLVSGCLLAPYALGLYWRGTTVKGVWAGIITALVVMLGGSAVVGLNSSLIPTLSAISIVLPIFVVYFVSLFTKKMDKRYLDYIYDTGFNSENKNNDNRNGNGNDFNLENHEIPEKVNIRYKKIDNKE
ncbi:sodium/proline symporter [Methanococcus voltae PS]|uniref:Sodium/proline symporter n=1 Tax=Methanococcus voltae PS TaxID=523842 RepID=A0ABT2EXH8_METVO|nr:sodium:solute symporter family protein [Methanococcus voltae]MCS3922560.1 sodium/proline symporter [Methanococcus voltae PS]